MDARPPQEQSLQQRRNSSVHLQRQREGRGPFVSNLVTLQTQRLERVGFAERCPKIHRTLVCDEVVAEAIRVYRCIRRKTCTTRACTKIYPRFRLRVSRVGSASVRPNRSEDALSISISGSIRHGHPTCMYVPLYETSLTHSRCSKRLFSIAIASANVVAAMSPHAFPPRLGVAWKTQAQKQS